MSVSPRCLSVAAALLLTVIEIFPAVRRAEAACGTLEAGRIVSREFGRRMKCEFRRARGRPIDCADPAAVCAEDVDDLAAMLEGASNERACLRELYRQPRQYARRRYRELTLGRRGATRAVPFVAKIARRCAGQNMKLGGACASATQPEDAAFCLRASVEALLQKASGQHVRPNIVLVLTDDQRWDSLWAMPLLQEHIGRRGIDFTNSFTSTSLCCPDRASIFTGLYAHNHGVTSNAGARDFDHEGDTIQRQLQENAGYKTALVGKYMVATGAALGANAPPGWDQWHVFLDDGGLGTPFGLYYDYRLTTNGNVERYAPLDQDGVPIQRHQYSTDLLRDRSLALIDAWRSEPFFLEYAPFAPHTVAYPADRHLGVFSWLEPARPPNHMEGALTMANKPVWVQQFKGLMQLAGTLPEVPDARRIRMHETLPAVDEAIAALSERLERYGLTDNTLFAFTSDNGYMYGEHWLTLKNYPYEESIRVPLQVRYPLRVPAQRVEPALVQSIDFYPTFAEVAGIAGASVNGRSLVPLLDDPAVPWRDEILFEHFGGWYTGANTGIRTHAWKLIRTTATSGVTLELYDMNTDPFELDNRAEDPALAAVVADLSARLDLLEQE